MLKMTPSNYPQSLHHASFVRPFVVNFLYNGTPDSLLVLAKSECHAVQVMLRYFDLYYHSIDMVTYDSSLPECFVTPVFHFSDSLYKLLKKYYHGNN